MNTIKFRGKDQRGNTFYGSYDQNMGAIFDNQYAAVYAVEKNSVQQFVGFDSDGRELYDGDNVIDSHGDSYTVRLAPILENDKGVLIFADLPDGRLEPRPVELRLVRDNPGG